MWKEQAGCHRARSWGYRLRKGQVGCLRDRAAPYALRAVRALPCFSFSAAPGKAVELCSTPRKFFEKNLTKNFYLSLPSFSSSSPRTSARD